MSTFKNSVTRKFGTPSDQHSLASFKTTGNSKFMYRSFNNHTPGPGTYRIPSEFGKHDASFFNTFSESVSPCKSPAKRSSTSVSQTRRKIRSGFSESRVEESDANDEARVVEAL